MKVLLIAFVFAVSICFVSASSKNTLKAKPGPQLVQLAMCVEAPASVTTAWEKRWSQRENCTFQTARNNARTKARDDAFNAVEDDCRNDISAAEAEDLCRRSGRSVANVNSAPSDSLPRPGGSGIENQTSIPNTSLCVTLRDYQPETTRGAKECGLFWGEKTFKVKFTVLARCGVKCFPLD